METLELITYLLIYLNVFTFFLISKETFDKIQENIKKLDWKKVKQSVEAIAEIAKIFLKVIQDCHSTSQAVADLIEKLASALSGFGFIEAAIRIITNPLKFYELIERIISGFKGKKFNDAGEAMGEFVGSVIGIRSHQPEKILVKGESY